MMLHPTLPVRTMPRQSVPVKSPSPRRFVSGSVKVPRSRASSSATRDIAVRAGLFSSSSKSAICGNANPA